MSEGHLITFAFVVCFFSAGFFLAFFVAVVALTKVTRGTVIKYMCFSSGFLSFAVLICTWKIVKYNSLFLPDSLALHFPII